ncbi:MAG: lipopolysaccharide biosynthesis protein [Gammaproteobacteria bacterium]|nr:MAG: lipopolysaccharide biosynthesis protein [Gammaproteobacteria bacterium]
MEKIFQELLQHARATWHRRWWIVPIAWVVCLAGWAYIQTIPDVYASDSRVFVNTQSVLDPLLRGMTVRPDAQQRLQIVTRTLLSRDNLEQIARQADLDVLTGNQDRDSQVNMLRSGLRLDGGQRDNIYNVSFRHQNPEVAYRVVQETVNLFMERGLGDTRLDLTSSQAFIERQLEIYEQQLAAKERELEQFRRENTRFLSGGGDIYSRLESTRQQLRQAQLELNEAERSMQALAGHSSGAARALYENPELSRRISNLEGELDSMRLRYTDVHPDVISTTRVLSELRERREQEAAAFAANPRAMLEQGGTAGESMRLTLAQAESRVASLRARVQEFENRVAELEADVDRALEVESESTALNRDYDVLKRSFDQLLQSRERAIMSGQVETMTDAVDFRVLEPPRRPSSPASPNRPALASAVLILGLGAGTGFAWLLTQLRNTVHNTRQLASVTGRPVLGFVAKVDTPMRRHRRRSELLIFSAATSGLLLVFAGIMIAYATGAKDLLDRIVGFIL